MNKELLDSYEEDVRDSRKAVEDAARDLKDAVNWHQKMLLQYAQDIIKLDKYKKDHASDNS